MKSKKRSKSRPKTPCPELPSAATAPAGLMLKDQLRPSRIVFFLAMIALAYRFAAVFVGYMKWAAMAIRFPFSLDYGEGPLLGQTVRLAHFENIYHHFLSPPPPISHYPPLFMLVQAPLYFIFGPAFWYGRLISIISAFLGALFIFLTIFTLTRSRIGSAVGGLLLFAFPYVRIWSLLNRIDLLAFAFSWAALFVTVRYVGPTDDRQLPKWGLWLAVSLFVMSIYTRQTYALAGPFAAVAWLAFGTTGSWKSRIRLAVKFGLMVGGITMAVFLALDVLTRGGFYLNTVTANINTFDWEKVYVHVREIRSGFYPLLIISALFLLIEPWIAKQRTRTWPLALSYLLGAAAASVTIGKEGSNVNYLIEFCAALSLASGSALAWIAGLKWNGKVWAQALIVAVLALQLGMLANWRGSDFHDFGSFLTRRVADRQNDEMLEQIVKSAPGMVLADEYMGLLPLAGKDIYVEPFGFRQLVMAHVADETSFVKDIQNRRFGAILLYRTKMWNAIRERWTRAQLAAMESSYRLDTKIGDVLVLRPKKPMSN